MAEIPQTRYIRSAGSDIAYQVFGSGGGEDLIAIPGFYLALEVIWVLREFASFLQRLASFRRMIVFDKRGPASRTGCAGCLPSSRNQPLTSQGAVMRIESSVTSVLSVCVDGAQLAELGPGAVVGSARCSSTTAAPRPSRPGGVAHVPGA